MKKITKEPVFRFLSIGFLLYLIWIALYEFWIHPKVWVDRWIVTNTLDISEALLLHLGYVVERTGDRLINIHGTPGLFMGDSCNGISLFALFSIFIIAFPGKILSKIIFIPMGILLIHVLNVVRVVSLSLIETFSYEWTEFNHTYTFTVLIYAFIFMMWIFWINKFSGIKRNTAI